MGKVFIWFQGGIAGQDGLMELLKPWAGFQAQFIAEYGAEPAERPERLADVAGAVERCHQQTTEVLVHRVLRHQQRQLAHQVGMTAQGKIGFDAALEHAQPGRFQRCRLQFEHAPYGDVDQGGPAPQRQRTAEQVRSCSLIARLGGMPADAGEPLEFFGIRRT